MITSLRSVALVSLIFIFQFYTCFAYFVTHFIVDKVKDKRPRYIYFIMFFCVFAGDVRKLELIWRILVRH